MVVKCEFCEKWDFENVNFVKNETFKMWIFSKMRSWKCEFCEKWDFEIVNFVKKETLKLWIWWKMRLWNCEFGEKWDFENVNFVKNETLKLVNLWINWGFLPKCETPRPSEIRGKLLEKLHFSEKPNMKYTSLWPQRSLKGLHYFKCFHAREAKGQ